MFSLILVPIAIGCLGLVIDRIGAVKSRNNNFWLWPVLSVFGINLAFTGISLIAPLLFGTLPTLWPLAILELLMAALLIYAGARIGWLLVWRDFCATRNPKPHRP